MQERSQIDRNPLLTMLVLYTVNLELPIFKFINAMNNPRKVLFRINKYN